MNITSDSRSPAAATTSTLPAAETVLAAIRGRRSVRNFRPTRMGKETILRLLDAAVHAPTAVHEEPWQFAIVQDRDVLKRLSDRAKRLSLDQFSGGAAVPYPEAMPASLHALVDRLSDPDFNVFYDAGTLIVIGARPLGPFVTADCWLAAENLMLAAHALGLGTCCIGFALAALNTPESKAELRLPADTTAVAAIIVGEPAEATAPAPTERRPPNIVAWL